MYICLRTEISTKLRQATFYIILTLKKIIIHYFSDTSDVFYLTEQMPVFFSQVIRQAKRIEKIYRIDCIFCSMNIAYGFLVVHYLITQ